VFGLAEWLIVSKKCQNWRLTQKKSVQPRARSETNQFHLGGDGRAEVFVSAAVESFLAAALHDLCADPS